MLRFTEVRAIMSTMSHPLTRENAFLALNALPHVGPITVQKLMEVFENDPVKILKAQADELQGIEGVGKSIIETITHWRDHFDLEKEAANMQKLNVQFISSTHEDYPPYLKEIYDPPIGLYCRGSYRPGLRSVSIVGSRRCSLYGTKMAKELAAQLVHLGFCVISGMARGIDTAAHEGALDAGGKTVGVFGCGVDIIYPPENFSLSERIREHGALVSEFKLGQRADKRSFPMRNRIVSGMSQAVIVVETNCNGGSMITARMAGEQGRQVFAVPGRVDQASSSGCHQLIRDGAVLLRSIDDLLEELSYLRQVEFNFKDNANDSPQLGKQASMGAAPNYSTQETLILKNLMGEKPLTIDEICTRTQLASKDVTSTLMLLELKKALVKRADGTFEAA